MTTAINGFRKTGIWPPDLNVFSDADFLPSATTDIQLENNCPIEKSADCDLTADSPVTLEQRKIQENLTNEPTHGCSWQQDSPRISGNSQDEAAFVTSPEVVVPIPLIKQTTKRTKRKRGKTVILTDSPYKNELQESIAKRTEREK